MLKKILISISSIFSTLLILYGVYFGFTHYLYFEDLYFLKTTPAGSAAEQLSSTLKLTDAGRQVMFGTKPKIDEKVQFNSDCNPGQNINELGCYKNGTSEMYLLKINEPSLMSMTDVAGAHELLHGVYERMQPSEKAKINKLIEAELDKRINDKNLADRLKVYQVTEPGNQDNELHSIFGSEYPGVSPELEAHYQKYFTDRAMIVTWHTQNANYISSKETSISSQKAKIESDKSRLDALDSRMSSLLAQNRISEYNSLVSTQNALVRSLRAAVDTYNADIIAYNDIIKSIDSHSFSSFDSSQIRGAQ